MKKCKLLVIKNKEGHITKIIGAYSDNNIEKGEDHLQLLDGLLNSENEMVDYVDVEVKDTQRMRSDSGKAKKAQKAKLTKFEKPKSNGREKGVASEEISMNDKVPGEIEMN